MQDVMRRLIEMKAQQQSELGEQDMPDNIGASDSEKLQMVNSFPEQDDISEQDLEASIQDPEAPEEVRKAAIQRVRQKYLGQ